MRALVAIALSLALLPACRTVQKVESTATEAATNVFMPPSQERELGKKLIPEVEKDLKILGNAKVTDYVRGVGNRIVRASDNPDKWSFTYKVVDDPKTVNAFVTPGGHVYVYTGLLKAVKDEAELAGVLAHEVAHTTQRHVAEKMVRAYGLQAVAGAALGKDPKLVSQIAAGLVMQGTLLKYSRTDESEADLVGVVALAKAGYDPNAMVEFFGTLAKAEGGARMPELLSSHPDPRNRMQALQVRIREKNLRGTDRNPAAIQAIQAELK